MEQPDAHEIYSHTGIQNMSAWVPDASTCIALPSRQRVHDDFISLLCRIGKYRISLLVQDISARCKHESLHHTPE